MPRGRGLRIRLTRIPGITAKGVLAKPLYLTPLGPFSVSEEASHREYETHRSGQYSIPAQGPATARMLRDAGPIETMTIDWDAPWMIENNDPQEVKAELGAVLRSRKPVELLAIMKLGQGPEELRMYVTLRRSTRELRPGEADTRYWTIEIREYRKNEMDRKSADAANDRLPRTVTLHTGDTLESLAARWHGSPNSWRSVGNANGLRAWGRRTPIVNSSRFKAGDRFKIPKKPGSVAADRGLLAVPGGRRR